MKKLIPLLALTLAIVSCATSPEGRKQAMLIPEGQVDSMGVQSFDQMKSQTPIERDPATNAYVKCVANAITSALPDKQNWEVVVFKNEEPNAFALPGAKIGVQTGILKVASTPDQLGAVLGHEVGHVLAKHGAERMSDQLLAQGVVMGAGLILSRKNMSEQNFQMAMAALGVGAQVGVLLPFSRSQESEADIIGLKLMAQAGFNPEESIQLWRNMSANGGPGAPEFLSTHPANEARMQNLANHMAEAKAIYAKAKSHPNCKR